MIVQNMILNYLYLQLLISVAPKYANMENMEMPSLSWMGFVLVVQSSLACNCVHACKAWDGNQRGHWDVQLNALIRMAVHNIAGGLMMANS